MIVTRMEIADCVSLAFDSRRPTSTHSSPLPTPCAPAQRFSRSWTPCPTAATDICATCGPTWPTCQCSARPNDTSRRL